MTEFIGVDLKWRSDGDHLCYFFRYSYGDPRPWLVSFVSSAFLFLVFLFLVFLFFVCDEFFRSVFDIKFVLRGTDRPAFLATSLLNGDGVSRAREPEPWELFLVLLFFLFYFFSCDESFIFRFDFLFLVVRTVQLYLQRPSPMGMV